MSERISPKSRPDRIYNETNDKHPSMILIGPFFEKNIADYFKNNRNRCEEIKDNFWRHFSGIKNEE